MKTSVEDQIIARETLDRLEGFSERIERLDRAEIHLRIEEMNELVAIPKPAFLLLRSILVQISEHDSVSILPDEAEYSTQQAADLIGVSRPHLVKLLENNTIPFKKVGSHRRVLLKDINTYRLGLEKVREQKLRYLSEQAQELNLGYE